MLNHFISRRPAAQRPPAAPRLGVLGLGLAALLLSGCTLFHAKPAAQLPEDLPDTWATKVAISDLPITAGLLDRIESPQARHLVEEALANNPDLKATALRLKSAGYLLSLPNAERRPQVTGRYEVERHNQGIDARSGKRETVDRQRVTLGISWEIDIWGRLADEVTAARSRYQAHSWEYRHARDALAARVLQEWIEQIATGLAIQVSNNRLEALLGIERLLLDRYRNGIGSLDELDTARTRTAVARADLSELCADRQIALKRLEVLMGRYPRGDLLIDAQLPRIVAPPAALPATTLLERPDIQAALATVLAAQYQWQAARKARLPSLNLSGQVFKQSASLDNLWGTTAHWHLLGSLFQPLLDGGRLRNTARAQQVEARAALLEMRGLVLKALQEVETALIYDRELARQTTALRRAATTAAKSSQLYERRYRQGLNSLQSLLIAREQAVLVKLRLNPVEAACLRNRIDLALALGVGAGQDVSNHSGGES
jgi:NodT family efflux transporter outer membrane factor (OMF) lipoprotein